MDCPIGGPVSIPHVYNGANRTFFFFGWEGERYNTGQTVVTTVPTLLQRDGDFSQTIVGFANGRHRPTGLCLDLSIRIIFPEEFGQSMPVFREPRLAPMA